LKIATTACRHCEGEAEAIQRTVGIASQARNDDGRAMQWRWAGVDNGVKRCIAKKICPKCDVFSKKLAQVKNLLYLCRLEYLKMRCARVAEGSKKSECSPALQRCSRGKKYGNTDS
jgi:hypothetical protein